MAERPRNLHTSKSFTRLESTHTTKDPLARSRATTIQGPAVPDILDPLKERIIPEDDEGHVDGDVFARKGSTDEDDSQPKDAPDTFEELPIEIRSVTERYCQPNVS